MGLKVKGLGFAGSGLRWGGAGVSDLGLLQP